ncbi:maleylpyruvate isomerase N-terminal domain-containing protein [Ilumatobacter nonamiensis]|uniref:maleylpyruvate isomerase N-terminal domain-containing protein n=1 Tax=Ilumatobacter nonamiensis TaxID=467093 RepID=UPI000684C7DF|nr:maleylpyruvate isomerase N-terminal domain-containing protein [Ilumatobacter nonamiensis]
MRTDCHVNLTGVALTSDEIERDVTLGTSAHAALMTRLAALADEDRLEVADASRLPGWNRAQVITHLARNADGHRRMIEGAGRGEILEQYPGGVATRQHGIDAGVDRTSTEVLADLSAAIGALEAAWSSTDWRGVGHRTVRGDTPIGRLPFLRVREVALHGVDLDIGIELSDLDPLYVRLEIGRLEMLWSARQPMGMTPLPNAVLSLDPPTRLGWLTGRVDVDGVDPAGVF